MLSLANNHMLDQGIDGFAETQRALAALGIATIGDGRRRACRGPSISAASTIAFAAFTRMAQCEPPGIRRPGDDARRFCSRRFRRAAGRRRPTSSASSPIGTGSSGIFPRPPTRALARRLAESGAGLIVGNHAHVLQPAERIGETLVAYGLGDFLGTALPRQPWPDRHRSDARRRHQRRAGRPKASLPATRSCRSSG